jgi:hypothetical protein
MGRINKIINGGFRHIINKKEDKIKLFITEITKETSQSDEETTEFIKIYGELSDRLKDDLLFLSCLEELILQKTNYSILEFKKDFKSISLTENNGYIYARHPFYKNNGDSNDIRVIMGRTKDLEPIITLKSNMSFIENCSIKLSFSMLKIIEDTKSELVKYSGVKREEYNENYL